MTWVGPITIRVGPTTLLYTKYMPAKNRIKIYQSNTYYHIYNRGIDKRVIFIDTQDYQMFIQSLVQYLTLVAPIIKSGFKSQKPSLVQHRKTMNLSGEVKLCAYCLMPNHFHLIIRQETADGITKLMRRICTQYAMYFNKKYKRQGTLFENIYRAVIVPEDERLLLLSRYIHLNPVAKTVRRFGLVETVAGSLPEEYPFSSYQSYLPTGKNIGIDTSYIISLLANQSYQEFMQSEDSKWLSKLKDLALDLDGQ